MIQSEKKAIELISQKYLSRIVALNENKDVVRQSILDSKNGTLFSICNSQYTFRDFDGDFWLTIPKSLIVNDKRYYPVVGDTYACDEIKYHFITKKDVIEIATNYFEKFIDPFYGFDVNWQLNFFCDEVNGKKHRYQLVESKFKSCAHKEIKAYISFN